VPASGSTFPVGVTTVTNIATDIGGNQAACTFTVTVNDAQDPSITCPTDLTVSANVGACFATGVVLGSPTASDNCGAVTISSNAPVTTSTRSVSRRSFEERLTGLTPDLLPFIFDAQSALRGDLHHTWMCA